jgi:hypothetical protein
VNELELHQPNANDPDTADALALTIEDVARQLAYINSQADDPEVAHGAADDLHQQVLRAIAAGHPDAQILAAAALRTEDIEFDRWYA